MGSTWVLSFCIGHVASPHKNKVKKGWGLGTRLVLSTEGLGHFDLPTILLAAPHTEKSVPLLVETLYLEDRKKGGKSQIICYGGQFKCNHSVVSSSHDAELGSWTRRLDCGRVRRMR